MAFLWKWKRRAASLAGFRVRFLTAPKKISSVGYKLDKVNGNGGHAGPRGHMCRPKDGLAAEAPETTVHCYPLKGVGGGKFLTVNNLLGTENPLFLPPRLK